MKPMPKSERQGPLCVLGALRPGSDPVMVSLFCYVALHRPFLPAMVALHCLLGLLFPPWSSDFVKLPCIGLSTVERNAFNGSVC